MAAIVAGLLLELGAQETGWTAALTYSLAGAVATGLIILGVPYSFGYRLLIRPVETPKAFAAATVPFAWSESATMNDTATPIPALSQRGKEWRESISTAPPDAVHIAEKITLYAGLQEQMTGRYRAQIGAEQSRLPIGELTSVVAAPIPSLARP